MLTIKIIEKQVIGVLKEIYDPELPVNIYDLGLIYFVNIKKSLESVIKCDVEVTFDPPWDRSFMSEEAKLDLGFL